MELHGGGSHLSANMATKGGCGGGATTMPGAMAAVAMAALGVA
jgi:hypothetical protein